MAAREGVGAALTRRLRIFEESAMDGGVLTLLLVRGISREIKHKRVTSVEVNSNQTSFGNRSFEESSHGWLGFRRGICTLKRLGVIWSSLTAH